MLYLSPSSKFMMACGHSNYRNCITNLQSYGVNNSCPLRRSPLEEYDELCFRRLCVQSKLWVLAEGDTENDSAELVAMIVKL